MQSQFFALFKLVYTYLKHKGFLNIHLKIKA